MQLTMTYESGAGYLIQQYTTIAGERYPRFHTLRAFLNQGDALIFREILQTNRIDPMLYIRSFVKGTVCIGLKSKGKGRPTLDVRSISSLAESV